MQSVWEGAGRGQGVSPGPGLVPRWWLLTAPCRRGPRQPLPAPGPPGAQDASHTAGSCWDSMFGPVLAGHLCAGSGRGWRAACASQWSPGPLWAGSQPPAPRARPQGSELVLGRREKLGEPSWLLVCLRAGLPQCPTPLVLRRWDEGSQPSDLDTRTSSRLTLENSCHPETRDRYVPRWRSRSSGERLLACSAPRPTPRGQQSGTGLEPRGCPTTEPALGRGDSDPACGQKTRF